jgi:membrane dipeptidase
LKEEMRPIFDSHLDLAWNALSFNRDLTLSVEEIRAREEGLSDEPGRGRNTLTFVELRKAMVPVCVVTVLARSGPKQQRKEVSKRSDLDFSSQTIAYAAAQGQLAYYRLMEKRGWVRMIRTRAELKTHWSSWLEHRTSNIEHRTSNEVPLGIILSMEGADPVVAVDQLREWWDAGLRAIGLAHYGVGQYAYGTATDGPLSEEGLKLLKEMQKLGMIYDVTHSSDISMEQALDVFGGRVLASHHNCRSLVPGDRQLTDEQIKKLIARDAVIGVALDAWMLYPNWVRGQTKPEVVGLEAVADHIDHVCQLAGDCRHSAIGTDLDGGYGNEQTPRDLKRFSDLQKLGPILLKRGYKDADIDLIFYGNWLRFFSEALPG